MPSEEERALLRELAERGVSVRFVAELPLKSADELAPAEAVLRDALESTRDERLIRPLALALRHPRFRSALPILVEKLGAVRTASTQHSLIHAITTMGIHGHEAEVARSLPSVRSRLQRAGLEQALREAGYELPTAPAGREPVLGPRGRSLVGWGSVVLGAGCLGGVAWLALQGGLTPVLRSLGTLLGLAFLFFGAAFLWRPRWAFGAYLVWSVAALAFQLLFQQTYQVVPGPLFWANQAVFVVALVVVGTHYRRDFEPPERS